MQINAIEIIRKLDLIRHTEGGYFRETYRSDEKYNYHTDIYTGNRNFYSSIYYLLSENEFSSFHRLKSDEIWHYYEGSSFQIHIINNDGILETKILGNGILNGESYQVLINKGNWFAAELSNKKSFGLAGCTVAPGFDYNDLELGNRNELIKKYPQHEKYIRRLTK